MGTKCVKRVSNAQGHWVILERITPGYKPWYLIKKRTPVKDETWWFWPRLDWLPVQQTASLEEAEAFITILPIPTD